jgi:hypothetical protein
VVESQKVVIAGGVQVAAAADLARDIHDVLGYRTSWRYDIVIAEDVGDATNINLVRAFAKGWLARNAKEGKAMEIFKPGVYRHFKGDTYRAMGLITHHHTRRPWVKYFDKDGTENMRPLESSPEDSSAWTDVVEHEGRQVRRFELVEEP